MSLSLLIISIFILSAPVSIAGRETRLSLPKRASLQQVLAFLQDIRKLMKLMKENAPTYRLHKRDDGNIIEEDDDKLLIQSKQQFPKESTLYPVLNRFSPVPAHD